MPKFFNKQENIEKISGVYIPFWFYSIKSDGEMKVSAKRIKTWRVFDTIYTKTDLYTVERNESMNYGRIPVDGSKRFDDDLMNTIEPFNYNEMVDYNHAYLSGFLAEKYVVDDEKARQIAMKRTKATTKDTMYSSIIGYDTKSITSSTFSETVENAEYVLLTVWMVNIKFKEKYYTFDMNAQTGEFVGNIPTSAGKTLLYTVLIFGLVFGIIILISYLIYLGGNA